MNEQVLANASAIDLLSGRVKKLENSAGGDDVVSGGSGGKVQIASSTETYTSIASVTVPEDGLYIVCPWVLAYGKASTTAGTINANINTSAGESGGVTYAAKNMVAVPAFTAATDSEFSWSFIRSFSASDVLYLNVNHTTGKTRDVRGGIYIYKLV